MPAAPKVFGIILAGGEGKRLMPLTEDRAKPAVPFGGQYRLIDFAISNLINSGLRQIVVLTQYKSHSLDRHVSQTWRMSALLNSYVASVPAQQRLGKRWFSGSADAILQSLNLIHDEKPDIVVVIGADHVYRMDFEQMLAAHIESGAKATVAGIRQPIGLANQFGVIDLDPSDNVTIRDFLEKPQNPTGLADAPHEVLASMGNYIFDADALIAAVEADGELPGSNHDMGGDIIPISWGAARRRCMTSSATTCRARPIATATTGGMWARSTRSSTRTWISSRRCRSSTSTTSTGRSTRSR